MKRWIPLIVKIVAGLLLFVIVVWIGAAFYISSNKEKIRQTIITEVNQKISGQFSVGTIEPNMLRGFPGVALTLNNVILRDSLWSTHKKDLINAKKIHVSLNVLSLLTGKTNIRRILINNAKINILTDSSGYTNTALFKPKSPSQPKEKEGSNNLEIRNIDFKDVHFMMDNAKKNKKFDFQVHNLSGSIRYPIGGFKGELDLKTQVNVFSFNTKRGSFLKDKLLSGVLKFEFNNADGLLTIAPNRLNIGKDRFTIGAILNSKTEGFDISVKADNIQFQNIARLLAPNISEKLLRFNIDKDVNVNGNIIDDGSGRYADPLIRVTLVAKNSKVNIPAGQLERAGFTGKFTNQQMANKPIGDENSVIEFTKLTADYYNVPISIDTFLIQNLSKPVAIGRVKSNFSIDKLNKTVGTDLLQFKSGTVALNLYCRADIEDFKFTKPFLNGKVEIKNADILYVPTKTNLANSALTLSFNDKDLRLTNNNLKMGKSALNLSMEIKNFLNFYYTAPEQILVDIKLASAQLNLGELIPILSPRSKKTKKKTSGNKINDFVNQFATILEQSRMNVQVDVNKAVYKKFVATNLKANASLIGPSVQLNNISLNHAGGSLKMSGDVKHAGNRNVFNLQAKINRVNVKEFFYAFDNFGQVGISDKNIRGILTSQAKLSGALSNTGTLLPRSLGGTLNFNIANAALLNYTPLIKAAKFAFSNRDFSNIKMQNLNGRFNINGEKIKIFPLEISSSVINMNIEGLYSMGKGTNIFFDIPLRNPERDANLSATEKRANRMKGIVVRLKAVDDEDGGVKIRLASNREKTRK